MAIGGCLRGVKKVSKGKEIMQSGRVPTLTSRGLKLV